MGRKKNPNNNYFNQEVEDAVCRYLHSTDDRERNEAFKLIYPALCKIAEVWYHKCKFSYSDDDMEDVMASCVAHLVEKMDMFKCGRGTKAFSYYTVTARFYYILQNNKNYKLFQRYTPLSYMNVNWDVRNTDERDNKAMEAQSLLENFVLYLQANFDSLFTTKQFKVFGKGLIDVLDNFENLESINRRKIIHQLALIDGMPSAHNCTKILNYITAQFNLFKERFESGNPSLELIEKTDLTAEEKQYIRDKFSMGSKQTGVAGLAKKFGVTEWVVRRYVSSIDSQYKLSH